MRTSEETLPLVNERDWLPVPFFYKKIVQKVLLIINFKPRTVHGSPRYRKWILFDRILICKLNHLFVVCEILITELCLHLLIIFFNEPDD